MPGDFGTVERADEGEKESEDGEKTEWRFAVDHSGSSDAIFLQAVLGVCASSRVPPVTPDRRIDPSLAKFIG